MKVISSLFHELLAGSVIALMEDLGAEGSGKSYNPKNAGDSGGGSGSENPSGGGGTPTIIKPPRPEEDKSGYA